MLKVTEAIGVEIYIYPNGGDLVWLGKDDSIVSAENQNKETSVLHNKWFKIKVTSGFKVVVVPKLNAYDTYYSFVYYIDGLTNDEAEAALE